MSLLEMIYFSERPPEVRFLRVEGASAILEWRGHVAGVGLETECRGPLGGEFPLGEAGLATRIENMIRRDPVANISEELLAYHALTGHPGVFSVPHGGDE
jgi:hypothetical protein